jgi:hypothetical protein
MGVDFSSLIPLLLVGVIALIIGGIIGFLISNLFNEDKHEKRKIPKDLQELVILFRDRRNSRIVIGIKNNFFRSIEDLPVKAVRTLEQLNIEFGNWISINTKRSNLPEPGNHPLRSISDRKENKSASDGEPKSNESNTGTRSIQSQTIPIQVQEDQVTLEPEGDSTKSIAAQIDQIIQEKITNSIFKDRSIRLKENPVSGVEVLIDGIKYETVNEVEEEVIRDFIRECVAEWEKKAGSL